jgi:hypothetical protein
MDTDIYLGLSEITIARIQGRAAERTHIRHMVSFPIETLRQLEAQSIKDGTDYHIVLGGVIAQLEICVKERPLT